MKRGRLSTERAPIAEINVTPFVDVLLVLVVVLLIASPFLQRQIPLDLPKEKLKNHGTDDKKRLIISMNGKGELFLGSQKYTLKKLINQVSSQGSEQLEQRIYLRADRKVAYEKVMHLMAKLKSIGAKRIGLMVDEAP